MPETIVLRVSPNEENPHSWMVVDAAGTRIGAVSYGAIADLVSVAEHRQITVLMPANDCLVSHSELPLKSTQKLLQALPFSFEDQMIGGVEDTHFSFGAREENGRFPVAAINREKLANVLQSLDDANLVAQLIIPEDSAVPVTENGCTILLEEDEGMLRVPSGDVVSIAHDSLLVALQMAGADREDDDGGTMPVTVYIDDASGESGEQTVNAIHDLYPQTEFRRLPHGALSKLAVESLRSGHPNLLQGDFAASTSFEKAFEPWRYAAVAAGLLAALFIGYKAVELKTMKSRLSAANTAMMDLARQTFPAQSQIPDPVALFKSRMGGQETGESVFIDYLHIISEATKSDDGLSLERLNYRPGNLDLEVTAPTVQVLDKFTNSISGTPDWSASLQSTKPAGDIVQGRLSVTKEGQ